MSAFKKIRPGGKFNPIDVDPDPPDADTTADESSQAEETSDYFGSDDEDLPIIHLPRAAMPRTRVQEI